MMTIEKRNKAAVLFAVVTAFILSSHEVIASVSITEIMYDLSGTDSDREWVEIRNEGGELDIAGFKFNDGSSHVLNAPPLNGGQGSMVLGSGSFAILAANASIFITEYPSYHGTVIDTVMSLPNTTGSISILNKDGVVIESAGYSKDLGGAGDGMSLQLSQGKFIAATPTPGLVGGTENENISSDIEESESPSTSSIANTSSRQKSGIKADAGEDRTVAARSAVLFEAFQSPDAKVLSGIKYNWNFGDGGTEKGPVVMHSFEYPGTYKVRLLAYSGGNAATDTVVVKVISSPVVVQEFSPQRIVIKNNSNDEIDLSLWRLETASSSWKFPTGTYILPKTELPLSYRTTGLIPKTAEKVRMLFPNGEIASMSDDVSRLVVQTAAVVSTTKKIVVQKTVDMEADIPKSQEVYLDNALNLADGSLAGPSYSGEVEKNVVQTSGETNILKWLIFLSGFLGLVIFFVFNMSSAPDVVSETKRDGRLPRAEEFDIEEELL